MLLRLIDVREVSPERLAALDREGASGIALPLPRTRLPIPSAAEEAFKRGLAAWGWIEAEESPGTPDLNRVRRLVEGYPMLDGYLLSPAVPEFLQACYWQLPGYRLVPVVTPDRLQAALQELSHPPLAAVILSAETCARAQEEMEGFLEECSVHAPQTRLIAIVAETGTVREEPDDLDFRIRE